MVSIQRKIALLIACAVVMANLAVLPLGHSAVLSAVRPNTHVTLAGLPDFTDLVDRYGPAVVNVSVAAMPAAPRVDAFVPQAFSGSAFHGPAFHESPFFRYFGAAMSEGPAPMLHGEGSGFIVSSDGVILTNAHVVQGADTVTVRLTDRREFKARVLGLDARTDIAVLKIDALRLPVVQFGSDANVRVGQWVVAIGSPFGFENSVTSGIVSAKARSLPNGSAVPFLQTDVPLNPGNSGGPLFDLSGRVIGVNSQIYSRTGGYEGIGFAIPIEVALKVERQILRTGKVEHGHLGVDVQDLSPPLARAFGLDSVEGVLIGNVEPGSPAANSGLQPGDIVRRFNGAPMHDAAAFAVAVADQAPAAVVKFEVWRGGDNMLLTTTLTDSKDSEPSAQGDAAAGKAFGLAVRMLTDAERSANGLVGGLLVQDVSGAGARAGLMRGDVVLAINGEALRTPQQLSAVAAANNKAIALLVRRGAVQIYVPIEAG